MKADSSFSGNLFMRCGFRLIVLVFGLCNGVNGVNGTAVGQEPPQPDANSGLAVATALESVLMKVIDEAADSVVPIAIFRAGGVAATNRIVGGRGFRFTDPSSTPPLDAVPDRATR